MIESIPEGLQSAQSSPQDTASSTESSYSDSSSFFQQSILHNLKELKENRSAKNTMQTSMHIDENGVSPLHFFSANIFSTDSSFIPDTIQSIVKSITNSKGEFTDEDMNPQEDYLAINLYDTPHTVKEYYDKYFFVDKNGLTPVDTIIVAAKSADKKPDELKATLEKVLTTEYSIGGSKTEEKYSGVVETQQETPQKSTKLKFYNPLSSLVDEKNVKLYQKLYSQSETSPDSTGPTATLQNDPTYTFLSEIQKINEEKIQSESSESTASSVSPVSSSPKEEVRTETTTESISDSEPEKQHNYYFIQGEFDSVNIPTKLELNRISNLNNEIEKILTNIKTPHVIYFNCAFKQIEIKTIKPILTKLNITNYAGYQFKILIELQNDNLSKFNAEHIVHYLFLYKPTDGSSTTTGGSPSISLHSLSSQLESLFKLRLP